MGIKVTAVRNEIKETLVAEKKAILEVGESKEPPGKIGKTGPQGQTESRGIQGIQGLRGEKGIKGYYQRLQGVNVVGAHKGIAGPRVSPTDKVI